MAGTSSALDVSAQTEDTNRYMQASTVNVSNFVTVKLSGQSNYPIWKAQMLCLIESQMMRGIIDTGFPLPGGSMNFDKSEPYDTLLKGWIFGSIDHNVLKSFVHIESARQVWNTLESYYNPPVSSSTDASSPGFMFRSKFASVPEIELTEDIKLKMKLYEATVEGCWWKAKWMMKNHEDAATMVISENGNTMLHLAVEMGQNYFVKQLLMFLENGKDVEKTNLDGRTALHIAALVDNKSAAKLLVHKRHELLLILDYKAQSPMDIAYNSLKLNTYVYLLRFAPPSYNLSCYPDAYTQNAVKLIVTSIKMKQYDLASILLKKYPELVLKNDQILMTLAGSFPTDLNFMESYIYPSYDNVRQKLLTRGSLLIHYYVLYKCAEAISSVGEIYQSTSYSWLSKLFMILRVATSTLYPIYELICLLILVLRFSFSMLYFLMWKVLTAIVLPIKHIEAKKQKYEEANKILSLICDQIGTKRSCYSGPILEAVRQDAYKVVDEILYWAPDTINCQDEEGHNVIQLAIKYRSKKVYNLIRHVIVRMESYRTMKDSSMNNLMHLAGRLAPSSVLCRTTGAALQLQRELQWLEEVENLMSPLELKEQNIYMETPEMLFRREHADLMKQGENWTKTTAESCSITAAINVTVAFAAAITVPGGSNQESGIPLLKKETAFAVFAVYNALSLFTAVTTLLVFLSVLLATGFSEKDFMFKLPKRLFYGLYTLFLSTVAMIQAFAASLFLVFCDRNPWMLIPIIAFSWIPIGVLTVLDMPQLFAFLQSTYSPLFGRANYIDRCKSNRENTIFFLK